MDRLNRYGGDGQSTPTNPTIEQFLRDGSESGSSRRSPTSLSLSPTIGSGREHDLDEEHVHGPVQKKSVLMKVKEKAKKLRHTLSSKKKHSEDGISTPSWGVSLEDEDGSEVEDAEYLGAPMYESELAPEGYKEYARQHPRAVPVISEKHVLPFSVKQGSDSLSPDKPDAQTNSSAKSVAAATTSPNKSITEAVTEKLAPAYATVSDATHAIALKIQNLAVSATAAATSHQQQPGSAPAAPHVSPINVSSGSILAPSNPAPTYTRSESAPAAGKNTTSVDQQIWDRGVSVKQYLMHKFEPGEDERALSQVISEAMSPRRSGGGDHLGVVEKVREAVHSLLRNDPQDHQSVSSNSVYARSATMPNTASHIPVSTNAHEVVEEENHGRILQAN